MTCCLVILHWKPYIDHILHFYLLGVYQACLYTIWNTDHIWNWYIDISGKPLWPKSPTFGFWQVFVGRINMGRHSQETHSCEMHIEMTSRPLICPCLRFDCHLSTPRLQRKVPGHLDVVLDVMKMVAGLASSVPNCKCWSPSSGTVLAPICGIGGPAKYMACVPFGNIFFPFYDLWKACSCLYTQYILENFEWLPSPPQNTQLPPTTCAKWSHNSLLPWTIFSAIVSSLPWLPLCLVSIVGQWPLADNPKCVIWCLLNAYLYTSIKCVFFIE